MFLLPCDNHKCFIFNGSSIIRSLSLTEYKLRRLSSAFHHAPLGVFLWNVESKSKQSKEYKAVVVLYKHCIGWDIFSFLFLNYFLVLMNVPHTWIHMKLYLFYLKFVFIVETERMNEIKHSNEMKFYCLLAITSVFLKHSTMFWSKNNPLKTVWKEYIMKTKIDTNLPSIFCIYEVDTNELIITGECHSHLKHFLNFIV